MIVAEWKADPSRMGTPVIHTHLILLQIAIRMIANLAFDPSLPAMVYIEKRTVRTTLKVGGNAEKDSKRTISALFLCNRKFHRSF